MSILDIFFPEKCLYCKKYGNYICKECLKKLNNKHIFKKVDNDYFDYIICGSSYRKQAKLQLHNFKFHEKSYLYKYFIELILNNENICKFLKRFDLITYVPMTLNKKLLRGYNQSELLAKELSRRLDIEVVGLIEKTKENQVQSSLTKDEREKNVEGVFKIILKNNLSIKNKNIILVDDIFTTGATLRANSKILKNNEVNKICVFTIFKT